MRTYTIKKVQGAPDWSTVPVMAIDNLLWTEEVDISAQAQICWDEENLYLRMEAREANIRMEEKGLLAVCCKDSCLEFFFNPIKNDPRYINFEINPNGASWVAFGTSKKDTIRMLVRYPREMFEPQVEFTKTGWVLTYRIPYVFIRCIFPAFAPKAGDEMRANVYKCGEKTVVPHFMSWNPIPLKRPNFHCPKHFGKLIFGD